jgi:hypothetical protein
VKEAQFFWLWVVFGLYYGIYRILFEVRGGLLFFNIVSVFPFLFALFF